MCCLITKILQNIKECCSLLEALCVVWMGLWFGRICKKQDDNRHKETIGNAILCF